MFYIFTKNLKINKICSNFLKLFLNLTKKFWLCFEKYFNSLCEFYINIPKKFSKVC